MKIAHIDYQFIIELNENDKFLLIVENPKAFRNIICFHKCEIIHENQRNVKFM